MPRPRQRESPDHTSDGGASREVGRARQATRGGFIGWRTYLNNTHAAKTSPTPAIIKYTSRKLSA